MNTIWCDTETTGIDPMNSGAFEIAFLFVKDGKVKDERLFYLNPLNETIKYQKEAAEVHGRSEEEIRNFPPAEAIVPNIAKFFSEIIKESCDGEKLVFAGYSCKFDYRHLSSLFKRCGFNLDDYFFKQFDAMDMVKTAVKQKAIPYLKNLKLTTVCKTLNIDLKDAHTALADIKATRNVCIRLFKQGVKI